MGSVQVEIVKVPQILLEEPAYKILALQSCAGNIVIESVSGNEKGVKDMK